MNRLKKHYERLAFGLAMLMAFGVAHAADDSGVSSLFDSIDLSGIASKVLALGIIIVGIALVIKGPSIVKRLIAKI